MTENNVISELINIFDDSHVLFDDESKKIYGKDLTQNYHANPLAIVFPQSEAQVVAVVKFANEHKIGLVPSGGRTGYSGGAVALNGEIVVSFDKMRNIVSFDAGVMQVTCEPGVTTKTIQEFAVKNNLFYPVDFASSGTSQMGGNIATNAGGIKVIRYGLTRNWVCGLPSGTKTFFVYRKINGRPERITIGNIKDFSPEQARGKAAEINALIARGENPAQKNRLAKAEITLGELFQEYLARYAKIHKSSWPEDERQSNYYLSHWKQRKLSIIRRNDIQKLHQEARI